MISTLNTLGPEFRDESLVNFVLDNSTVGQERPGDGTGWSSAVECDSDGIVSISAWNDVEVTARGRRRAVGGVKRCSPIARAVSVDCD